MKGKLFAISGPSGVGKNSVLSRVMQLRDRVQYSISATSRPMRPGEIDGKSYYFVTRAQFEQMIAAGELLEHAEYVGNYYGTPLKPILTALEAGTDVVMDVDVVGALNIKKRLPEAVLVFLTAPSMAEIRLLSVSAACPYYIRYSAKKLLLIARCAARRLHFRRSWAILERKKEKRSEL